MERNRIGFFTPSLGLADAGACLEFVKARGGLVQAWTLSPALAHEVKPGLDPETLISGVRRSEIRVSSLSGYMDWTKERDHELRRHEFRNILGQCRECGCTIVCTETGRDFESRDDKRAWGLLVDSMKLLCREAEQLGVTIAIEMGRMDLIYGVDAFRRLQELVGSDCLKINFDPANLVRGNINPLQAADALKNDVVQVHLKDAVAEGMRPLTKGAVDFKALVTMFENNSFRGNYIIEAEYPSEDKAQSVALDYDNILKTLGL